MEKSNVKPPPSLIQAYVDDLRAFLTVNREAWPRALSEMPDLTWHSLNGFVYNHKQCRNPTLKKMTQFERAACLIDPGYIVQK
jgi:hypothetical protein